MFLWACICVLVMTEKTVFGECTIIYLQNGHKRCGNEGDHRDARHADQRLHMQVFMGQRDRVVVIWVTEPTGHTTAELSLPSSATGMLHFAPFSLRCVIFIFCVSLGLFCVLWLFFLVLTLFSQYQPRDWLGRASPKWPSYFVSNGTLNLNSIN